MACVKAHFILIFVSGVNLGKVGDLGLDKC